MFKAVLRVASLAVFLSVSLGAAQADQLIFQVPVEVKEIENLDRVTVSCIVAKDPMAELIGERADFSKQATSRERKTRVLYGPDTPQCRHGNANELCMRHGETGLSWQGTIDVAINDFDNGGLAVADARQYLCKTIVGYLRTGKRSDGVSILADRNCKGQLQYRAGYRNATGGDIADHLLCRQANLNEPPALIEVPSMHLRGGQPQGARDFANLNLHTTVESGKLRSGRRYADFRVGDYEECARACLNDDDCQSWSGYDSHRGGRCYLLSTAPDPRPACSYCVTGRRTVSVPQQSPTSRGVKPVLREAMQAHKAGDDCRAARILAPHADDPAARAMRQKFQSACNE